MIIRICEHILEGGRHCGGAARHGQRFCRHHMDLRARLLREGRAERQIHLSFKLPLLQDVQAVNVARARVRYALDSGHMDASTARQLFFGLRLAADNLRFMEREARWRDLVEAELDRQAAARIGGNLAANSNQLYQVPISS